MRIVCAAQLCIPLVPGIVHETTVAGRGTFDQPRFPSAQTTCILSPPALAPRGLHRRKGCRRRVAGRPETLRVQFLPRAIAWARDHAERPRRGLVSARRAVCDNTLECGAGSPRSQFAASSRGLGGTLPRLTDCYSMGSIEEAVIAWEIMASAWEKYPEAQVWLRSQGSKRSGAQKKGKETMR